jgi:hypothetical protein
MLKTETIDIHDARFIREKGLEALTRELGPVGTVYFLRQFNSGKGNWTEDRKKELAGLAIEDIEKDIAKLRSTPMRYFLIQIFKRQIKNEADFRPPPSHTINHKPVPSQQQVDFKDGTSGAVLECPAKTERHAGTAHEDEIGK